MEAILAAYLELLVEDAAHALAGYYTFLYKPLPCEQALRILQRGLDGTLEDPLVEAACVIMGREPAAVYQALLDRTNRRATTLVAGKRKVRARHAVYSGGKAG